jgi:hypothetical protein
VNQSSTFRIDETSFHRVKYGDEPEDWGASTDACGSCGVAPGEFHLPGCFVERCPKCRGQAVSCRCNYDEPFTRHPISDARRRFYKLFYLAVVPMGLVGLVLSLIPFDLPGMLKIGVVLGVPSVLSAAFWNKFGEMELRQIISTLKRGSAEKNE